MKGEHNLIPGQALYMVQSGAICAKVQDFQREANCLFDAVASIPKVSTPKTLELDLVSYVRDLLYNRLFSAGLTRTDLSSSSHWRPPNGLMESMLYLGEFIRSVSLFLVVNDTQSDSIQYLNFAKK